MAILDTALAGVASNVAGMTAAASHLANLNTQGSCAPRQNVPSGTATPTAPEPAATASDDTPPSSVDPAGEVIDFQRYEMGARANLVMIRIADRTRGSLLDVFG